MRLTLTGYRLDAVRFILLHRTLAMLRCGAGGRLAKGQCEKGHICPTERLVQPLRWC